MRVTRRSIRAPLLAGERHLPVIVCPGVTIGGSARVVRAVG
jgi:hypothetical protein